MSKPIRFFADGDTARLDEIDPGLFLYNDTVAFKTEYRTDFGGIEAFIVETGEIFSAEKATGGVIEKLNALMVQPLCRRSPYLTVKEAAAHYGERCCSKLNGKDWDGTIDHFLLKWMSMGEAKEVSLLG